MTADSHPDPFGEASHSVAREAAQFASIIVSLGRVVVKRKMNRQQLQAARTERERRALKAQQSAERAAARARWAPANDPAWLRNASLLDTAAVWGAAVPYADPSREPSAVSAVQNCEGRLRELHPYAMARYDRLRGDGLSPAEAMAEALPLFRRPPHAYERAAARRAALGPGDGLTPAWAESGFGPDFMQAEAETERQLRRGRWIVDGMQGRAWQDGRPPLGEAEQISALESMTTLPAEIIPKVIRPARVTASAAPPWKQDFPIPIEQVLAATQERKPAVPETARQAARAAGQRSRR